MKKIYIVDDDKDIVESISIVLKSAGYEIADQNDENDVVENIKKFEADLIILDVMFPENVSAGFDIARLIKADEDIASKPVLMLSAINEKGIFVGTFSNKDRDGSYLPVNEFIEKPIAPDVLLETVKKYLG